MVQQLRAMSVAPPVAAAETTLASPEMTLTGWLTTIWGDGPSGTATTPPLFYLTLADGRSLSLKSANDELDLLALSGQQVTVVGNFDNGRSANRDSFVVTAVDSAGLSQRQGEEGILGPQPWLSILCKFSDYSEEPQQLGYFLDMYSSNYPGLDHYWRELSYDAMNLNGSTAVGWYTLPYTRGHYLYDESPFLYDLFRDCTAAADADVDFTQFAGINLMFNVDFGPMAYGGQTFFELDGVAQMWRNTWNPPWGYGNQTVMGHEMGHGFGLPHSLDPYGYEYGNPWDVMSGLWLNCEFAQHPIYGCLGQHTLAFYKDQLGWIPDTKQVLVSPGEHVTVSLSRLAQPTTADPLIAKIALGGPTSNALFTVEARQKVGYDTKLWQPAVVVHQVPHYFPQPQLMISGTLGVGDSYHDTPGQITITVLSENATGYVVDINYATFSCNQQTGVSVSECEALIALYNQTNGDNWFNSPNWFYGSLCNWYGVVCDGGHVIQLYLADNNLTGPIPQVLGDLPYLESLVLSGNAFNEPVPEWLFTDLPALRSLDISRAGLTGNVPVSIGSAPSLQALVLASNQLTGTIPTELGNLSQLITLDLNDNQLHGAIPATLGSLTNLQFLNLSKNQLSGPVPTELSGLTNLLSFNVAENELNGPFPTAVSHMTVLFSLFLNDNQFTGTIPSDLSNLPNLREVLAQNNHLSGPVPTDLSLFPNLYFLDLSHNDLSGPLPTAVASFLSVLKLADNELTGTIPISLFDSPGYAIIDLSHNHLAGGIPAAVTHSQYLWEFNVSHNRLIGGLPIEFGDLIYLNSLDISANQFEAIPTTLTNLVNLETLDVGYNKILVRNAALRQFLTEKDADWAVTQTVPPTAVRVSSYTSTTAQLIWATIPYTADGGYYEISYALAPTGTYTVHGVTADKTVNTYLVDNLQPDAPYYFRVRTFTPAHEDQQNDLWSPYSSRVFIPVTEIFLPVMMKP